MYDIWKVPVDAYDDPPTCGTKQTPIGDYSLACQVADVIMQWESDSDYAYFVVDINGYSPYNVGYIAPEVTA